MIIATKNANALSAVNILKNNESGHHCKESTMAVVPCAVSTDRTDHNIRVAPKNSNDQYIIYINDFTAVLTFSASHQFITSSIHTITIYITNNANHIYLMTSRILPPATLVPHHATTLEFG